MMRNDFEKRCSKNLFDFAFILGLFCSKTTILCSLKKKKKLDILILYFIGRIIFFSLKTKSTVFFTMEKKLGICSEKPVLMINWTLILHQNENYGTKLRSYLYI